MKYELILSDFDGTLLRNDLTVDKSVADAIRGYINRGGHFVVCTGGDFADRCRNCAMFSAAAEAHAGSVFTALRRAVARSDRDRA